MNKCILSQFPKKDNEKTNISTIIIVAVCLFGIIAVVVGYNLSKHEAELPELKAEPIPKKQIIIEEVSEVEHKSEPEQKRMSDEDIMAMVVMAEAGNQDMLGKVAVASTILNRCDMWGMTVETVINQPNQYTFPYYGTVTDECYRAVEIAQENRDLFPEDMLYFRAYKYHDFGTPYEQIGSHYFSLEGGTEE